METQFELWDNTNKKIVSVNAKRAGKEWNCLCPFHDDKVPSMFINTEKQTYFCHSCQSSGKLHDPDYEKKKLNIVATYDYVDETGNLIYQVVRLKPKDFRQRRPDGEDGWIWNLEDIKQLPYHLDEVVNSKKNIIICEGEKDVDNLRKIEFLATCNSGGAGKWKPELNEYFRDRNVAIIMDNDILNPKTGYKPGEKHAHEVAEQLNGIAKLVVVISLPGLKEKQDVSDWLKNKLGDREELIKLIKSASQWKPEDKPKPVSVESKPVEPMGEALANIPFKFLGFNYGYYYYLPNMAIQVVQLSRESHRKNSLLSIAPLNWWENAFPSTNGSVHWDSAVNWLYRRNEKMGTYDSRRIRGCGAWYDEGRIVVHLGNYLWVNGETMPIDALKTRFIYEISNPANIDFKNPLSNEEASKFLDICRMLAWENPLSAYLLAGWCVSAVICGALDWRPHIWICGAVGTGKTTIMEDIISKVLGNFQLPVSSSTTAPGIIQGLRNNAFPVLFDEAVTNQIFHRERMIKILDVMRQASSQTGQVILKGTSCGNPIEYRIRSSFAFASVLAAIEEKADESRISVLSLIKEPPMIGKARYNKLEKELAATLTNNYCSGFRARAIQSIPIIKPNIEPFSNYFTELYGQRTGDQYGTLIACARSLVSKNIVTKEEAKSWISVQDWSAQSISDEEENSCLDRILSSKVTVSTPTIRLERSVIELIMISIGDKQNENSGISKEDGESTLKRHGLRVYEEYLFIANSHNEVKKMLKDSPWSVGWKDILRRVPGAVEKANFRFDNRGMRVVGIPLSSIFQNED